MPCNASVEDDTVVKFCFLHLEHSTAVGDGRKFRTNICKKQTDICVPLLQMRQIAEEITSVKQSSSLRRQGEGRVGACSQKNILVGLGETLVHIGLI